VTSCTFEYDEKLKVHRILNTVKSRTIREQTKFWDDEIRNIWDMVTIKGFRSKEIAQHYGMNRNSMLQVLNRRNISLVRWRHEFAKGMGFTWVKEIKVSMR
jgi:hypothetical protein